MIRYPAGEQITVPRHVETSNVRTMLTAATVVPHHRLARARGAGACRFSSPCARRRNGW